MSAFDDLTVFLAIAEAGNFRAASDRLGVTRPAVSQAVRRLEDRIGIALVQRTTRSMRLTEAGERLREQVTPAVAEVSAALTAIGSERTEPRGRLRLAVSSIAEHFLSGPLLAAFIDRYPQIQLDVTITDAEFDIVAAGYDAGVRLGEVIEQDMIAVAVSDDQRQVVVGAPAYVDRFGRPGHPRELPSHRCIGWRPAPELPPYRWEFTEHGRDFDVAVDPITTTNDMWLMIRLACAGGGLTFGMAETFAPYIARGELVPMLEDYCPPFSGFYLYYPSRRNVAPKLRALIDHVRRFRTAAAGNDIAHTI